MWLMLGEIICVFSFLIFVFVCGRKVGGSSLLLFIMVVVVMVVCMGVIERL